MKRINCRVSEDMNNWLGEYSKEIGVSKSAIVYIALEELKNKKNHLTMPIFNMSEFKKIEDKLNSIIEKT